jgi:hypothetical protein
VLIPIKDGQPVDERWQLSTVGFAKEPGNQAILASSDVAVQCGVESHHLAAIRFHGPEQRERFLLKNAPLRDSLMTSFPGAFLVWLRYAGLQPGPCEHPICDWVAEGSIMVAVRKEQKPPVYRLDHEGPPVTLAIKDILWPWPVSSAWAIPLASVRFAIGKSGGLGRPKLNDDFLADVWMNENPGLWFDSGTKTFYQVEEEQPIDGLLQPVCLEEIKKRLHQTLIGIKDLSSTSGKALSVDTSPRHLARLMTLLKILAAKPAGDRKIKAVPVAPAKEIVAFDAFIKAGLAATPGNEPLTAEEIYQVYVEFCLRRGLQRYSKRQFQTRLGNALRQAFGIGQSHDIIKDGRAKRGFRNLRVEPSFEKSRTERAHRADSPTPA